MIEPDTPIAYMDATCALCCFGARMIDRLDRSGDIRICPIQSARGQAVLAAHGINQTDPESWLFIDDTGAYQGFDAMIRVGKRSGGWGHGLRLVQLLPGPLRDALYRRIARSRYAIFGRADMCALPRPSLQARLIS